MVAVAYIRRSASEESPVSEDAQRATVAELAAANGHTLERVYRDWGRSGGSETRPEYIAMLAEAEAGNVHAIYAYDQDRLARSNYLFASLLRLADLHRFSVVTPAGDLTDDARRDFAEMRGLMDGAELRKMKRRARAIDAKQRKREDDRGVPPFGYAFAPREKRSDEPVRFVKVDPEGIAHVIDTYRREGTYLGTARALAAEGFKSKRGGDWHPVVVADLIRREAPELAATVTRGSRGRTTRPRLLRGLLRCGVILDDGTRCDGPMSPGFAGTTRKRNGVIVNLEGTGMYYCGRGQRGAHGGPHSIAESRLLPWIRDEADRLVDSDTYYREAGQWSDPKRLAAIVAARASGDDDVADMLQARYDAERTAQGEREQQAMDVPDRVDWDRWDVESVNRALRSLWEHVQLGPDLMPLRAEWHLPEHRRPD